MRIVNRAWWLVGLAVVLLTASVPANAATVEAMTLEEMAQRADFIFVGRAVDSRADWNVQRTRIYTYTTFQVERFIKGGTGGGSGEEQVTLRLWGGELGPMRSIVPGTPQFASGEEVLLFCVGSGARIPDTSGSRSGKVHADDSRRCGGNDAEARHLRTRPGELSDELPTRGHSSHKVSAFRRGGAHRPGARALTLSKENT